MRSHSANPAIIVSSIRPIALALLREAPPMSIKCKITPARSHAFVCRKAGVPEQTVEFEADYIRDAFAHTL